MKRTLATLIFGAVVLAGGHLRSLEAAQQSGTTGQQSGTQGAKGTTGTAEAVVPPPIAVEVVEVDPTDKTITVREIAAVPAPPNAKAIEVELPVTADATGQKLGDTKVGETVAVTCEVKPTVHPTAGVPIVLTDCAKVIKIDPKS